MNFFRILSRISVPLLVAAAFVYLVNAAGAVRDNILYSVEAIDAANNNDKLFRFALLAVFLVCLGLLFWASAQARVRSIFVTLGKHGKTGVSFAIALLTALPMLALLFAVRRATGAEIPTSHIAETGFLLQVVMAVVAIVVAILVFALPRRPFIENFEETRLALFSLVVATPTIFLMVALERDLIDTARMIGAFSITAAFFTAVLFVVNMVYMASKRIGAPIGRIIALAIVAMYAFLPPQFRPIGNTNYSRDALGLTQEQMTELRKKFIKAAETIIPSEQNDLFSKIKAEDKATLENYVAQAKVIGDMEKDYGALALGEKRGVPHGVRAFFEWLAARPDIDLYKKAGRKYPVYVVAAQGGGFYAASHAAMVLARLQDTCPAFREHVFLISSVSGGSLGSSLFTALAKNDTAPPSREFCNLDTPPSNTYQASVERFFEADFLSPVLAAFLFQDIPRLLLPVLPRRIDRAWALEEGFRRAFADLAGPGGENFFADPFFGKWQPTGTVPALAFNTTDVTSASSYVISDVMWSFLTRLRRQIPETQQACGNEIGRIILEYANNPVEAGRGGARAMECVIRRAKVQKDTPDPLAQSSILELAPDLQLSVAEAVSLSARFPYMTPSGVIDMRGGLPSIMQLATTDIAQFVDGGYSDGSGFAFGISLGREIAHAVDQGTAAAALGAFPPFEFILISIRDNADGAQQPVFGGRTYTNEAVAPLSTALKAREISQAGISQSATFGEFPVINLQLASAGFKPPLTWALSRRTRKEIWQRSGWLPSMGLDKAIISQHQMGMRVMFNHAPFEEILSYLGPTPPAPPPPGPLPAAGATAGAPLPGGGDAPTAQTTTGSP